MNKTALLILLLSVGRLTAGETSLMHLEIKPVVLEGIGVEVTSDEVRAPGGQPAVIQLAQIVSPLISQSQYEIKGLIQYSQVEEPGYLEMWSDFGAKGRFFSRTLATSGRMAHLVGDSGITPREFSLPFDTMGKVGSPKILELNLVLPKGGTVKFHMGLIRLVEFSTDPGAPWWDKKTGSYLSYTIAALGGLLGLGTSLLASRAPRLATASAWLGLGLGLLLLVTGLMAPFGGLPVVNCYPLLAGGVLVTILFAGLLWYISRLRQKDELRRMVAMDVG